MSYSALSDEFEYLHVCYDPADIIHIFTPTVRGSTLDVRISENQ